jgi:hypothetical protein
MLPTREFTGYRLQLPIKIYPNWQFTMYHIFSSLKLNKTNYISNEICDIIAYGKDSYFSTAQEFWTSIK